MAARRKDAEAQMPKEETVKQAELVNENLSSSIEAPTQDVVAEPVLRAGAVMEVDSEEDESQAIVDSKILKQIHQQKYYRLVINAGRNEQEQGAVPIGVNGIAYLIERNKECVVPKAVIDVLENAVEYKSVTREVDGQTTTEMMPTKRFSYSVLGEAPSPYAKGK